MYVHLNSDVVLGIVKFLYSYWDLKIDSLVSEQIHNFTMSLHVSISGSSAQLIRPSTLTKFRFMQQTSIFMS